MFWWIIQSQIHLVVSCSYWMENWMSWRRKPFHLISWWPCGLEQTFSFQSFWSHSRWIFHIKSELHWMLESSAHYSSWVPQCPEILSCSFQLLSGTSWWISVSFRRNKEMLLRGSETQSWLQSYYSGLFFFQTHRKCRTYMLGITSLSFASPFDSDHFGRLWYCVSTYNCAARCEEPHLQWYYINFELVEIRHY